MPTINKRFLVLLLLVTAVCTGLLFGVHAIQASRIPSALLRQAKRAVAEDQTDAAIRYFRQYLEFRPDDLDARVELAERLKSRGSNSELPFLYDAILRADSTRHTVRRDAVAMALGANSWAATRKSGAPAWVSAPAKATATKYPVLPGDR